MEAYKRWVRRNKDYVHSLESLANGMTWLLPERFSNSEIGPEAVTAFFGVITALNEHIIETSPSQPHLSRREPYAFPYALCISALKDLETLVEVAAEHYYGEVKKWNFIAVTEGIKVLLRLALLRDSGYKMLLHGGETPNTDELETTSNSRIKPGAFAEHGGPYGPIHAHQRHSQWNLEGRALSALNRFGESARMVADPRWLQKPPSPYSTSPSSQNIDKPALSTILSQRGLYGSLFLFSELLFITRPLIYVLFIRRYGLRSWIPWFLSLSVDLTSMGILAKVTTTQDSRRTRKHHLSPPENDEMKRRKLLLALYLMRDPFFSKYTRQKLEKTEKTVEPIPIIGLVASKIVELMIGAQSRYTYMSGS
uniref:Peroxisomal membrane protein PEX16 n=1 Tax=Kalanchoe fedtschenkoi TaxID=63787 RepID=A0A7N0UZK5_KALFE